ncbi:putative disease resistance protein isoform X3 [Iris pallida]|uniref:Disease resistance protein isoform X3 n=1 Tax=Iris pallida TaxID=29817 RepID=A0AAX6E985_IRIPA|nr:putative disease resistance protein isoform X3 [Iris pallida]
MAEAAVSFIVDKLGNFLVQELTLLHGVSDQVEQLQRELQRMQCFLHDADTKRKTDERVRHWVKEIRDVAHQAEDVIDTFIINAHRHRRRPGVSRFLKRWLLASTDVVGRRRVSKEITAIMARISEISASRITYGIKNLEDENCRGVERLVPVRRPIVPHVEDSDVVAFDGHMSALVEQLLHHSEKRSVMSIVGIGGLGKTTLARKVYNSVEVKREFGIRVWITVSQDYGLVELLNEILEQVRKDKEKEKLEEVKVIEKLYDSLKEKRYLIVMDDVWSEDVWEQMQAAFPDEKNGSRVLITTRYLNVAKYADPTATPYELRFLTDVESLELLLKKAFANQDVQANCTEDLRSIGRQLVKLCANLPLALVVVGGLLSIREKKYSAWLRVLETMNWQVEGKKCMAILALSYEDLPHNLKSCFLYLAVFPEDSEIQARKLIRLWIAEGFIPRQGRGTIEETSEDYLEELAQRCMVQVVSRKFSCRSIKSCRVHDLLREFAVSEAKEDRFLVIYNNPNQDTTSPPGPGRRATFHNLDDLKDLTIPNLRSLFAFNMGQPNFRDFGAQLKLVRVIYLSGVRNIKSLPEEIKAMIHLRYLGLSGSTELEVIPSSIGHLQNLETLDVTRTNVKELPSTLWNIKKLRHVLVYARRGVEGPPPSADLPNLQTLGTVVVPESWGRGLPNITSVRKLRLLFCFQEGGKILSPLLEKLHHLLSLSVWVPPKMVRQTKNDVIPCCASNCLNDDNDAMNVEHHVTIPSGIDTSAFPCHHHIQSMRLRGRWYTTTVGSHEFPPYLVKLTLWDSKLEHDPMPTLEKLQSLRELELMKDSYLGEKMICSASGFPQLQRLLFSLLDQLEEWCLEAGAMPKITRVHIWRCKALRVVPEFQHVPNLQELELWNLPREFMDRISVDGGEDHYKIQNVQSVSIR